MLNQRHRRFLRRATEIARATSNGTSWNFGGVLVHRNRMISSGTNHPYKTHRRSNTDYRNIHCEFDCLLGINREKIIGSTLYVSRVGFNNRVNLMMARPCSHCRFALISAGVRDVYFTIDDQTIGYWNIGRNEEVVIQK